MGDNLAVSWDDYRKNMCNGFGALQQRGEFVDMTLAADGHHVKVHQMVMSLVSPYIKGLITSAHCPHPIIFMNGVSYQTMQAILEYAYTGEVIVSKDKISEFLQACKDLHIKGLESMMKSAQNTLSTMFLKANTEIRQSQGHSNDVAKETEMSSYDLDNDVSFQDDDDDNDDWPQPSEAKKRKADNTVAANTMQPDRVQFKEMGDEAQKKLDCGQLQYSVSCGGNLQAILNRYMYCLRHVRKDHTRFWRCTNQQASGCPAVLTTLQDTIVQRTHAHNHPFHDKQILKRLRTGNIYTSLTAVTSAAENKKSTVSCNDPVKKAISEYCDQTVVIPDDEESTQLSDIQPSDK